MEIFNNVCCGSRSSYFTLVMYDRHFGDICHVFECVDQSARSLAGALHDITMTSHEAAERRRSQLKEKMQTVNAIGGNGVERIIDDHNNNSVFIGMYSVRMGGVEVPQAPRGVGSVEGVSPSPMGKGSGEGAVPLPRKLFIFYC